MKGNNFELQQLTTALEEPSSAGYLPENLQSMYLEIRWLARWLVGTLLVVLVVWVGWLADLPQRLLVVLEVLEVTLGTGNQVNKFSPIVVVRATPFSMFQPNRF